MCGIAGLIDHNSSAEATTYQLRRMLASIAHRGPDDEGTWLEGPIALGHRRLSIIDLSALGHQPMISASGRYVIAFNGEIYNYLTLRRRLESSGVEFRGHSDTEVLLALVERLDLHEVLQQCLGMFAIALWDRHEQRLQLARDRFGEKPLYYGWQGGVLMFGSELKALAEHDCFERIIDRDSLGQFVRFGYVPSPHSIYRNIFKVEPGTILTLRLADVAAAAPGAPPTTAVSRYWSHEAATLAGMECPHSGGFEDAVDELEALLTDAVALQTQADVPVGALLSGGVDSSTVVALMRSRLHQPVRTYTIGFDIDAFDEARHAMAVARHLGTHHTELYVSSADALAVIPRLPQMYDEPLGDPSQIPTYLVAKLAREDVTVALSGDGADEIFLGYDKYATALRYLGIRHRRALGRAIGALPWRVLERTAMSFSSKLGHRLSADRASRLEAILTGTPSQVSEVFSVVIDREVDLVPGAVRRPSPFNRVRPTALADAAEGLLMLLDRESYLSDDILVKVDRASMAVSLESRAPFLDPRVSEFVARLPVDYLRQNGANKRILRAVLYRHVPQALVDRPKAGFSVPIATWLRSSLRQWAGDLLNGNRAAQLLDMGRCRALFAEHDAGWRDNSRALWCILGFLAWTDEWL